MRVVLDTNVVSELRKPYCDPCVQAWSEAQPATSLHLSTVTLAEIRYGIERHSDDGFRTTLTAWLDGTLRPWFTGRILGIDEDVILEWRRSIARGRERGITFGQPDLFIAAIAKLNDLTRPRGAARLSARPSALREALSYSRPPSQSADRSASHIGGLRRRIEPWMPVCAIG